MTTPTELEAAVERLKTDAQDELDAHAEWLAENPDEQDPGPEGIDVSPRTLLAILHALSEANERASLLQTAVHERCAERDEARKDIELLKHEVVAAIRDHRSTLVRAEAAEAENVKLREILAPVAALHGLKPPHVVIGRTVREAFFALNPHQEGSRDHG